MQIAVMESNWDPYCTDGAEPPVRQMLQRHQCQAQGWHRTETGTLGIGDGTARVSDYPRALMEPLNGATSDPDSDPSLTRVWPDPSLARV